MKERDYYALGRLGKKSSPPSRSPAPLSDQVNENNQRYKIQ